MNKTISEMLREINDSGKVKVAGLVPDRVFAADEEEEVWTVIDIVSWNDTDGGVIAEGLTAETAVKAAYERVMNGDWDSGFNHEN